jgi:hypothetical protein
MKLENIMLNEINQAQKNKCRIYIKNPLFLPIIAYTLSTTKLEIRAE